MKMRRTLLALAAMVITFTGAAAAQEAAEEKAEKQAEKAAKKPAVVPAAPAAAMKSAIEDPDYIIGPEDSLAINVWKETELSHAVQVRPDGKISLPLLNDLQAAGLSPQQLAASITEKLRKFIAEPQVTVIVTGILSRRIYIMGEVGKPGAVPLLHGMTVLQALSGSGAFSQFADTRKIYILRNENGKQVKYLFNYKEVIKGRHTEQNIELKPGDTIVVP
ncbi:MAG: sugar transporter [Acidipila sp.]|nr:sugar transporter [Acidipila sp.]